MKVYFPAIIPNLIHNNIKNKSSKIHKYLKEELSKIFIYSDCSIIEVRENKLFELIIHDVLIKEEILLYKSDKIKMIFDNSEIKYGNEIFQIPYNHIIEEKIVKKYQLLDKSKNYLIIELVNNNIHDFYIETNEKILTESLKEDIISFLIHLNLYK